MILLISLLLTQDARLTLKTEAAVGQDYVAVTDLVENDGLPGDLRARLATVFLGRAPAAGCTRLVTADDIRAELAWRGLSGVTIDGPAVLVTREDAAALSAQESALRFATLEIRKLAILSLPDRAANDIVVHVTYLDAKKIPADAEFVRVAARGPVEAGRGGYWLEGRDPATGATLVIPAVASIVFRQPVAYARRDILKGAKIVKEDFEIRREESDGTQGWVTQVDSIAGGQALEKIRAGEPLKGASVKLRPVVRNGEEVWARAEFMRVRARAKEDGAAGETIAMEFAESKSPFLGRVAGRGLVDVVEEN